MDWKQEFLYEAIKIGEELKVRAKLDKNGVFWITTIINSNGGIVRSSSGDIFSGTSGILLFFLELYKHTHNDSYLPLIKRTADWLEVYAFRNFNSNGFLTGNMGIAYVFLNLDNHIKDCFYLQKAINIAANCDEYLKNNQVAANFTQEAAGILLVLLHLYNTSKKYWLLNSIRLYVNYLIDNINFGRTGIYWNSMNNTSDVFFNPSQGASGIAFTFLELGSYFQNETFFWIAEQTFKYENDLLKVCNRKYSKKNWSNKKSSNPFLSIFKKVNCIKRNNRTGQNNIMSVMGMSRVRACQLLGRKKYAIEVLSTIDKDLNASITEVNSLDSFTLYNGLGGEALLFFEAYKVFNEDKYYEKAIAIAKKAFRFKQKNNFYLSGFEYAKNDEDYGLFMGSTGIGYLYLLLLNRHQSSSILNPGLMRHSYNDNLNRINALLSVDIKSLYQKLINKKFERTINIYKELTKINVLASIDSNQKQCKKKLIDHLKERIGQQNNECIKEVFNLEFTRLKLEEAMFDVKGWERSKDDYQIAKLFSKTDPFWNKQKFSLSPKAIIIKTKWSWDLGNKDWQNNLNKPQENNYILLFKTAQSLLEYELNQLSYNVLIEFKSSNKVSNALNHIANIYLKRLPIEQQLLLKIHCLQEIKSFFLKKILISN